MHTNDPSRRAPGAGHIFTRADKAGNETWYGKWGTGPLQRKRRLGPKRKAGTKSGLTRKQAEKELRDLMHEDDSAEPRTAVGERLSMEEAGRRYVKHLREQGRKPSTVRAAESVLEVWLVPHFGDKGLDRINAADVEDLIRKMRAKGLSAKSIRNYIGTLSALYKYATHARRKWARSNPATEVELPKAPANEEIRFLTVDEIDAVADAAVQGPYHASDRVLYLTAAMTGLRLGELIALRWQDVDFMAGRVRVRRNYVLGEFGTPKSRRSSRSVPLDDALAGELDRLARTVAGDQPEPDPDALVFASPLTGGPQSKAQILRRYRRALKAARLDATHRFHDLRHTFGTLAAGKGVPMRLLQEWMGHRDIATTQRYADYAPSAHEAQFIKSMFAERSIAVEPTKQPAT